MLLPLLLLACTPDAAGPDADGGAHAAETDAGGDTGASDTGAGAGPATFQFSYALIADPHVVSPTGDRIERLDAVVDWILDHQEERDIELVFILGDIAWNDGFDVTVDSLERLPVPWVPVIGDNCIQSADEEAWHEAFAPQLDELAGSLPGWTRQDGVVDNPVEGVPSWFQSYGFDHGGLRFVALDWNTRVVATGWGELPDLHDFDGGTLPFLEAELGGLEEGADERVIFLSHMPMFHGPGGFDVDEAAVLEGLLGPVADTVQGNHAGHLHGNGRMTWEEAGLEIDTTDATWDDVNALRVVEVWSDGVRFTYDDEIVEL